MLCMISIIWTKPTLCRPCTAEKFLLLISQHSFFRFVIQCFLFFSLLFSSSVPVLDIEWPKLFAFHSTGSTSRVEVRILHRQATMPLYQGTSSGVESKWTRRSFRPMALWSLSKKLQSTSPETARGWVALCPLHCQMCAIHEGVDSLHLLLDACKSPCFHESTKTYTIICMYVWTHMHLHISPFLFHAHTSWSEPVINGCIGGLSFMK